MRGVAGFDSCPLRRLPGSKGLGRAAGLLARAASALQTSSALGRLRAAARTSGDSIGWSRGTAIRRHPATGRGGERKQPLLRHRAAGSPPPPQLRRHPRPHGTGRGSTPARGGTARPRPAAALGAVGGTAQLGKGSWRQASWTRPSAGPVATGARGDGDSHRRPSHERNATEAGCSRCPAGFPRLPRGARAGEPVNQLLSQHVHSVPPDPPLVVDVDQQAGEHGRLHNHPEHLVR